MIQTGDDVDTLTNPSRKTISFRHLLRWYRKICLLI